MDALGQNERVEIYERVEFDPDPEDADEED
jgi:hypothetical protein